MTQVNFPVIQGGDGNTYSDDGGSQNDLLAGGHRQNLMKVVENAVAMAVSASAAAAASSAGTATNGTSSQSKTPGLGSVSLTDVQSGKSWQPGQWVIIADSTTPASKYMIGPVTAYSGTSLTVDVKYYSGAAGSSWVVSLTPPIPDSYRGYDAKTATYTLLVTDNAKALKYSGASSATFNFTPKANLSTGWWCSVWNATTAYNVTLDPDSSDQIDGLSTIVMLPGETRLIVYDGSAFHSFVTTPFSKVVTTTGAGSLTAVPPGYLAFELEIYAGGGGGGGSYNAVTVPATDVTEFSWVVGTGGAGGSADAVGGSGGDSSVQWASNQSIVTKGGGGGGKGITTTSGTGGGGGGVWGTGQTGATGSTGGGDGGEPNPGTTAMPDADFGGGRGQDNTYLAGSAGFGGGGGGCSKQGTSGDGGGSASGGGGGGGGGYQSSGGATGSIGNGGSPTGVGGNTSATAPARCGGIGSLGGTGTPGKDGGAPSGGGGGGGGFNAGTAGAGGAGGRGEVRIRGVI